jgi:nitrite reductase (NADH) large subunit
MVGHRFAAELRRLDHAGAWRVVVLAEEDQPAYDRTALSSHLDGRTAAELSLVEPGFLDDPLVRVHTNTMVSGIDRRIRLVSTADGARYGYDALVLATGSRPFIPPLPGHDLPGCFPYRTLSDLDAIRVAAVPGRPAVVIGGGLLGLEAANGLRLLGMRPYVVEVAPWLLPRQIDEPAAAIVARQVGALGIDLHCGVGVDAVEPGPAGRPAAVALADGRRLPADLVVFSAGIRPRDELAAGAGLDRAGRGGFLVDDRCRTRDPRIWAVGECAAVNGTCYGLVAPGYRMADAVVAQLLGRGDPVFHGMDPSTKLKLLGVEVASFGDAHAQTEGAVQLRYRRPGTYAKLVLCPDARVLRGGVLAGDAQAYPVLRRLLGHELPAPPERLLARV